MERRKVSQKGEREGVAVETDTGDEKQPSDIMAVCISEEGSGS